MQGKYILISEEGCDYLPFKSDTILLEGNKILSSHNFSEESTYALKCKDMNDLLYIHSPKDRASMTFTIRKGWDRKIKIFVCVDNQTRYEKL